MMEELNQTLFLWINATPDSPHWLITLAIFLAKDLIAIVPALVVALWLWGPKDHVTNQREMVLKTGIALLYALAIAWCLGMLFPHPRPFVLGLGYQFLYHAPDYSYPSDHGTAIFTFALAFLCWHRRWSGGLLMLIGVAMAWSRVYLGVHWPLDMVGGLLVGILGCLVSHMAWRFYGTQFLAIVSTFYRVIFALPIRKGWVRH